MPAKLLCLVEVDVLPHCYAGCCPYGFSLLRPDFVEASNSPVAPSLIYKAGACYIHLPPMPHSTCQRQEFPSCQGVDSVADMDCSDEN